MEDWSEWKVSLFLFLKVFNLFCVLSLTAIFFKTQKIIKNLQLYIFYFNLVLFNTWGLMKKPNCLLLKVSSDQSAKIPFKHFFQIFPDCWQNWLFGIFLLFFKSIIYLAFETKPSINLSSSAFSLHFNSQLYLKPSVN